MVSEVGQAFLLRNWQDGILAVAGYVVADSLDSEPSSGESEFSEQLLLPELGKATMECFLHWVENYCQSFPSCLF